MTLVDYCYTGMFSGCSSLEIAPILPATVLAYACYSSMFFECSSLISAPALPAITLAEGCYDSMFAYCTSLKYLPKLLASTLAIYCYHSMFMGCTALISVDVDALSAIVLADECYDNMFAACTSLLFPPELPAITLAYKCYHSMFYRCTSLLYPPKLLATTLCEYCYCNMFNDSNIILKNSSTLGLEYRIPTDGTISEVPNQALNYMFYNNGSIATPEPNQIYYFAQKSIDPKIRIVNLADYSVSQGSHAINVTVSNKPGYSKSDFSNTLTYTKE